MAIAIAVPAFTCLGEKISEERLAGMESWVMSLDASQINLYVNGIVDVTYLLFFAILSAAVSPDERVPSVREYGASALGNLNTVMRTYEKLIREGSINNRRGIGYYISPGAKDIIIKNERK